MWKKMSLYWVCEVLVWHNSRKVTEEPEDTGPHTFELLYTCFVSFFKP